MKTPRRKTGTSRASRKTGTAKAPARGGPALVPGRRSGRGRRRAVVRHETETLLRLEELLSERIVGKEEAIRRVADVVRIRRANLDFRPTRPDGAFLLVGPSGVGKTEFACAVAEVLQGGDSRVVLLDMADYSEEEDVEELLVAVHPEVEGLLIEGTLTTPVRNNPRSVVLFRGLEKAHPTVRRILHHILERGVIGDSQGEVRFNEAIIFATTRLVPNDMETVEEIGFKRSAMTREERWRKFLEDQFSPELVGAFNDVLFFDRLTPHEVKLIARYKVNSVLERLRRQKRGVEVSEQVYDTFIRDEDVRRAGARDLNRTLEEKIFTPLSKYLLSHADARQISIDIQAGRIVIRDRTR